MEMIMNDPKRKWSSREMAREAKELPWFKEHMPDYGHMTAYRDWLAIQEETADRRQELAEAYTVAQLDILDELMENVADDIRSMGSLDELVQQADMLEDAGGDGVDGYLSVDDIGKFAAAKAKAINSLLRVMERQGRLVPIEIAKKLEVNERRLNIDMLLELTGSTEILKKLGDGAIEGDFSELD